MASPALPFPEFLPEFLPASALENNAVRLEPLIAAHASPLRDIADQKGQAIFVHTHLGGTFDAYFEQALALRDPVRHVPFAVWDKRLGRYVGMTRLFSDAPEHRNCEIGFTWYDPQVWGTALNPSAKLALMTHAFETCGIERLQLVTDSRNAHSRAAILKLGAKFEGLLRSHRILPDGSRRDTASHAILRAEWPEVKAALIARIRALGATA